MVDREKVIKGLERCKLYNKVNCDKCPYDYNGRGNGKSECTAELASDALALLKEQEAIQVPEDKINKCECGETVCRYWHPKFCGFCGRNLLWY
jgi:hypothetical protein